MIYTKENIRKIFFILFLCAFLSAPAVKACGVAGNNFATSDSTWKIEKNLVVDSSGKASNELIEYIIEKLNSKSGRGARVSKREFLRYLNRPGADTVYAKQLIKYATPLSREIQKKEHEDFTNIFLNDKRLADGVKFIKKHRRILARAGKKYGIAIKDLVSILMWESGLGEFTGKYRIFNIFMGQVLFLDEAQKYAVSQLRKEGETNPLDDPEFAAAERRRLEYRKKDAANSLVALLRYCKKYGIDPMKQKGSWGGAVGFVQFMPYNFQYIVDADHNGEKDLFSWPDAINSAANFLKNYGGYRKSLAGRRRAFIKYNASPEYAEGVILYADELWKRYTESR